MPSPGVKTRSPSSRGLRTGEEWWPCWDLCSSARCRQVVSSVVGPRAVQGSMCAWEPSSSAERRLAGLVAGVFASVVTGPWGRGRWARGRMMLSSSWGFCPALPACWSTRGSLYGWGWRPGRSLLAVNSSKGVRGGGGSRACGSEQQERVGDESSRFSS